jgi:ATP-dependent Clp protease ATP-binding subunit ClpB
LGSDVISAQEEGELSPRTRDEVMEIVRRHFRPEFLNRLDEIILFRRLSRGDMAAIVNVQLVRLKKLLAERKIGLSLTPKALAWLAEAGYDPVYGARPLKRVIQRTLQNTLAEKMLAGGLLAGQTAQVDVGADNSLVVTAARSEDDQTPKALIA